MARTSSSSAKLHLVMYPWFAFGHFIPFLHLSNKLAQRGHAVSFVLPRGVRSKLESLNQHPNLIHFFPLVLPQVDGLPVGAETASDVPSFAQQNHLCTAYDQCKDQLEILLTSLSPKPDFVLTDFAYWVPPLARQMSIKTLFFSVVPAAVLALYVPSRKVVTEMPPGYPSSRIEFRPNEAEIVRGDQNEFGSGVLFSERVVTSLAGSDAIAICTCQETEASFCDYIAHQYQKPVLLTGPISQETSAAELEDKWVRWLSKFEPSSVVFCAFGSQAELQKDQYQELLLGFELCGYPFLVALPPPNGCSTVEEALPESYHERVRERGWVYGGWVPQIGILNHPSVGCFVSHGGSASMWESLLSDSQIVLVPIIAPQIVQTRFMVEELEVAVEVERSGENRWISKESLCNAIQLVMDKTSEVASRLRSNHANLKNILSRKSLQEEYMNAFVQNLHDLKDQEKTTSYKSGTTKPLHESHNDENLVH